MVLIWGWNTKMIKLAPHSLSLLLTNKYTHSIDTHMIHGLL